MKNSVRLGGLATLAVAMLLAMSAPALADHSPSFFVEWNADSSYEGYNTTFGNAGHNNVHANYLECTEKCAVCHAVHRAPVYGQKWDTNPADPSAYTPVAGGSNTPGGPPKYKRQEWDNTQNGQPSSQTQMLHHTSVANSCDYCHVYTSIGGEVLWAGDPTLKTSEWQEGFAHGNACSGCHAVHGVSANYSDPSKWGQYGVFQGAIKPKALKIRAKGSGGAAGSAAAYNWQDEVIAIGSAGRAEYAASGIAGAAAWANAQTPADYTGVNNPPDVIAVDPQNVPLFPSATDAIMGTNVRPDASTYDAQSAVFCTFCHQNYGYASEATVNPDADRSLFQGPWYALAGTVPNVSGASGTWTTMNGAGGYRAPFKNHPVKAVYGTFAAAGKSGTVPAQVAFANASTCLSCHDAGRNIDYIGVHVQCYPHFTPGYFHFVKSAPHAGGAMANAPSVPEAIDFTDAAGLAATKAWLEDPANYEKAVTVQDGQCLKCHVNATNDAGVGKTY